jgi:hypothetical protein
MIMIRILVVIGFMAVLLLGTKLGCSQPSATGRAAVAPSMPQPSELKKLTAPAPLPVNPSPNGE